MGGISKFKEEVEALDNDITVKQETFRNVITGDIYDLLKIENKTKADLSKSLGRSKAAITRMLKGDNNFTVDKIVELASALGYSPRIYFKKEQLPKSFITGMTERIRFSERTVRKITVTHKDKTICYEERKVKEWERLTAKIAMTHEYAG